MEQPDVFQISVMGVLPSIVYGFLLGIDPPRIFHSDRQRISILFCLGTTIFAQLLAAKVGAGSPVLMGLEWIVIFLLSALVAKHFFDPEARSYGPLVGISIFTGYLAGIGEWFPALVASVTHPLLLCILPGIFEEWLYGAPLREPELQVQHRKLKLNSKAIYASCLSLFLAAFIVALLQLDQTVSDKVRTWTAPILPFMKIATHLAEAKVLFPICAVLIAALWIKKARATLLPLLGMAAWCVGECITFFLKHAVGRPRPYLWHQSIADASNLAHFHWFSWESGRDYISFPSGHSTAFFAVAWIFATICETKPKLRFAILCMAAFLAIGRITLDQHFFADIVASAAIGIMSAQILVDTFRKRLEKQTFKLLEQSGVH